MFIKTNENKEKRKKIIVKNPSVVYSKNATDGVTLIALVVTIIILLILAGISINTLMGDNGIISKTENSKQVHEIGKYKELIQIARESARKKKQKDETIDYFRTIIDEIQKEKGVNTPEENQSPDIIKTKEGYVFKVTDNAVNLIETNDIMFDFETSGEIKIKRKPNTATGIQYKIGENGEWNEYGDENILTHVQSGDTVYARPIDNNGKAGVEIDLYIEKSNQVTLTISGLGSDILYYGKPGEKKSITILSKKKYTIIFDYCYGNNIEQKTIETTTDLNSLNTNPNFVRAKIPDTYIYTFGNNNDIITLYRTTNSIDFTNPERNGYTFNGWYTNKDYTVGPITDIAELTKDTTLYANWTINTSKLTINPNGGSVSVTSPAGGNTETISTNEKTYTQEYNTTLTYGIPTKKDSTTTSTYTVTYNYNGSGAANTTDTATKTVVTGYTFSGWTKSSAFYGTLSSTTGSGTYTYSADDNVRSIITANFTPITESLTTSVTLPTPTRTGYCFVGWYKEAAGTNKVGDAGGSYMPTANITLYAKWIQANGIVPVAKYMNISSINAYTGTSISENTTISPTYSTTNTLTVNGISYEVRIYRFSNNITINSGCTMTLGSSDDVGTASTNATRMVIAVFEGDLTNNGTITAYNTAYGGPKGMYICCKGTLTNNGTITMTARGAKAEGENVYLYSPDSSWATSEYVPAAGGTGGYGPSCSKTGEFGGFGDNGTAGTGRKTGRRRWWTTFNW